MSKVIGIDLGTTNSCVAVSVGGKTQVLAKNDNDTTTPSVVAYTDKDPEVIVGQPAKRYASIKPEDTVAAVKRLIGRRANDEDLEDYSKRSSNKIVPNENGDAWVEIKGEKKSPQEISAQILMKMKKLAEDYLGESVSKAVITVPAYFNDAQRQATKDAGTIAGLEVKRIINEPTAAALAYGLDKEDVSGKLAFYDLGGGTFDISIIEINRVDGVTQFEVLSTAGDTFLGGEDFDMRIVDWLAEEFEKEEGLDLRKDPDALQRLKEDAERAKKELSDSENTDITIDHVMGDKHLTQTLARWKLEELTGDLVERTLGPVEEALADAKVEVSDIEHVILVGGQTKMKLVRDKVEEFFGQRPRQDAKAHEAVAIGAAMQGAVLTDVADDVLEDVLLLDVTPLSLGTGVSDGTTKVLIERNTTIPATQSGVFTTVVDNQSVINIDVVQGERGRATDNLLLGNFDLNGIKPAPRGIPQIEMTFTIDADGILKVSAEEKGTGNANSIEIKGSSGLSEEEVERMVRKARQHAAEDEAFKHLAQTQNRAEATVYEAEKRLKKLGDEVSQGEQKQVRKMIDKVEKVRAGENPQTIEDARKNLAEVIQSLA